MCRGLCEIEYVKRHCLCFEKLYKDMKNWVHVSTDMHRHTHTHMHTCTYTHSYRNMNTYAHSHMSIDSYTYVPYTLPYNPYMCTYTNTCLHLCEHIDTYINTCRYTNTETLVHTHNTYMHIYTCTNTYNTHICTQTHACSCIPRKTPPQIHAHTDFKTGHNSLRASAWSLSHPRQHWVWLKKEHFWETELKWRKSKC